MAQKAHTPGPWTVDPRFPATVLAGNPDDAVIVADRAGNDPENIANARLIAAAPDMLEALRETVLQLQYLADKFGETGTGAAVLARVNAAIAKATGA